LSRKGSFKYTAREKITILQPGNTEDLRRAAAKAINRVLGKKIKPGLNLLHIPAAKKPPLHKKSSAEMAAKNTKQGRHYNAAAREYIRFEKTRQEPSTESLKEILSQSQFL
jgi:hypothetical protein